MKKTKAHQIIGEVLSAHLDVLDMTTGEGAATLHRLVTTVDDRERLAEALEVVGSGKLARGLRSLAACPFVICPVKDCGKRIDIIERKDFESYTMREYRDHYAEEHPDERKGKVGIPYASLQFEAS